MAEDKFGSGSISNQGGFKYSTPQERFARQLERDLEGGRKERRLSQSTLRKLITDDTAQWARNIYAEKTAKNAAINVLNTQNQSKLTSSAVTELGFGGAAGEVGIAGGGMASSGAASSSAEEVTGGGGGGGCNGLQLYVSGSNVLLSAAPIAGRILSVFNNGSAMLVGNTSEYFFVWVEIVIDEETGELTDSNITIESGPNQPDYSQFTSTKGFYILGNHSPSGITNYGCGGIDVTICKNWYRNAPPYYSLSIIRNASIIF